MGWHSLWIKNGKKKLKAGEIWDRIPVPQLARSRSKRQKEIEMWIEKDGFKPRLRLDWKIVETL